MTDIDTLTVADPQDLPPPRFRGRPGTLDGLTKLGRVQLSRHFFMRDFLYSEIAAAHGLSNVPPDPNLAIRAGRGLAINVLEPMIETFGPIAVRSAYRSPDVNEFGAENGLGCASNERNRAGHIWDLLDDEGKMGATVSVVIPWFARRYQDGRDWRDLAWWLYDKLGVGSTFFPKRAGFNVRWREGGDPTIRSWIGGNSVLLKPGETPSEDAATRAARYADFPPFRRLEYPL